MLSYPMLLSNLHHAHNDLFWPNTRLSSSRASQADSGASGGLGRDSRRLRAGLAVPRSAVLT